jgi:hypothetical protein
MHSRKLVAAYVEWKRLPFHIGEFMECSPIRCRNNRVSPDSWQHHIFREMRGRDNRLAILSSITNNYQYKDNLDMKQCRMLPRHSLGLDSLQLVQKSFIYAPVHCLFYSSS